MLRPEAFQASSGLILEGITHRGENDIGVGVDGLAGGAGTASAAANQAHPQHVFVFPGIESLGQKRRRGQRATHQRRSFQKVPP